MRPFSARGFSYQCVDARDACIVFRVFSIRASGVYSILCILNPRERCVFDSVYSQSAREVCILCIQIPGVYAALFEKVVACVCVCECEACVNVKRV